ncbi:MAG: protease modulator HflK [Opitutaceae bacterium]|nr:protease modulator HflK [Opitutaceae bacterium]
MSDDASQSARRRAARVSSGHALFGALAATIRLLRWLLLGLVALYLCSGITRVAPNEDALVYRLGRLQRQLHPPGLCFALPPPIDHVVKIPTRTQHEVLLHAWAPEETAAPAATAPPAAAPPQIPASLLAVMPQGNAGLAATPPATGKGLHPVFDGYTLTGDANIVQARLTARYRIADPFAYAASSQPDALPALVEGALLDAATAVLARTKIDDALGSGLETLRTRVRELAQQRLDALRLGLELVAFEVNSLTPPQATATAFADVTSAQVEARTTLEQARTYRAQTMPRAESEAFRTRQQAGAEAREIVTRARGETASFRSLLAEHRAAPALVEARLRAEALEQVLPRMKTKTLLPAGGGTLNVFLRDPK